VEERWRLTSNGRRGIIEAEELWKGRNCGYVVLMGWRFDGGEFIMISMEL